jgi:hypothetical protein
MVTTDQLTFQADQLFALENAIRIERLKTLAELDARGAHEEDGLATMSDWIAYRFGTSRRTANEELALGHRLREMPRTREHASRGLLSWDKVKQLARFVTASSEEEWADQAVGWTYREVQRAARVACRRLEDATESHNDRALHLDWDHDRGVLDIRGRISGTDGEAVLGALDRIATRFRREEKTSAEPLAALRADALVFLAQSHAESDLDRTRPLTVLHVTAESLGSEMGLAQLECGALVPADEARELACCGWVQIVVHGPGGNVIDVGRRTRVIPPPLMRELKLRDTCCVVCGGNVFLDGHHVKHWALGGGTELDNLVLLCWRCHRTLHRKGFRLGRDYRGEPILIRPNGSEVRRRPEPLEPEYRERILGPPATAHA